MTFLLDVMVLLSALVAASSILKHGASIIFCRMLAYASIMVSLTKVTDWEKMMLRLPPGMRERIAASAEERGRSMNADVIARIEASFKMEAEAHDSLRTNEELREFVNARFDEVEATAREQRLAFERMMAEAKKIFGDDLVEAAQAAAKRDVASESGRASG